MSDLDLMLTLTPEVRDKLQSIATQLGRTVEDCVQLSVAEFLESWDDYMRTVAELETGEEARPVLRAVND
ncbi:ribbon-helix-helix protein, CopG family [Telmatospirillum sp.]|uniref:ribbon-helix-helix protein, CopG family n=1 Tax=Telmatospirillum sp. TaxID=2079197 RepID=UPI00283D760E|nr:ribbon-helix-helix protein, CopG family [Telmatospirillum sp.]MDR3437543.1 ribbon-helix-helix protein, CopG family [Telmatospirillum sp.]